MTLAEDRKHRVKAFKKEAILQAAKQVFAETGLMGASIRSIAKASGYTPGAIYSYFDSKEHIYAEILAGVLDNVLARMQQSVENTSTPARACIFVLYDYYADRPDEFHLSYYLFDGMRRKGLTADLDTMLNRRLDLMVAELDAALAATPALNTGGISGISVMAHVTGVLLLNHTGRLKKRGHSGSDMIESYLALIT